MPRSVYQRMRSSIQCWCHSSASAGGTKNSISICSNSRVRKMKLPGVISLRNALPICAMPNGGLRRENWSTFLKLTKMPCAVSGRRKMRAASSRTGPMKVSNIRLNCARVAQLAAALGAAQLAVPAPGSRWSARQRFLHLPMHWTSGSVKLSTWPEASHVRGCIRIAASRATMSSRSCTFARHHSALTLFLSRTP